MAEPNDPWNAALARAHAAWPADWIPAETFLAYLRARLPADREPDAALAELAVPDLYLACACALAVAPAVDRFTRTILAEVDAHVARFDASAAFKDDVRQTLATKLLTGATPAIADYGGRAPLSAWVRVAAMRAAMNLRRGKAAKLERVVDGADAIAVGGDVELDVIRQRYGPAFQAAVERALAALPTRDRTILRLRLEGMEVERIAAMYSVHRTTVTRWLAECRAALLAETRRILIDELGASPAELDSLAGALVSQLHVSIVRVLGER